MNNYKSEETRSEVIFSFGIVKNIEKLQTNDLSTKFSIFQLAIQLKNITKSNQIT
jgi:hypothetical protein